MDDYEDQPRSFVTALRSKLIVVALILAALALFTAFDLGRFLDLAYIKESQSESAAYFAAHPVSSVAIYFGIYVLITGLSIPGASIFSLAGGALFGLWLGTAIVWSASIIGATLAFWSSRYLLRDWLQRRFSRQIIAVNLGLERDGLFYLLSLRLLPIFPFFVINLLMGLTTIRTWPYCWISAIGTLCGSIIYVNAGTHLASISQLQDIATPGVIGAFLLLGLVPMIAKTLVKRFR